MALIKDAYGKERVPGSSSGSNTTSGSTPAPTGSSVNEQQRAEQTAMRNMQKSSGSASGSSSQAPSTNSFGNNSQAASSSLFRSGQSSAFATGNAWKSTFTSGSNINQEQRAEQFSARRMGTTLQTRQGGSGSYLGSQLQQQKPAAETTPTRQTKPADETKSTTQKQPQYQPYLSDRIKTRQEMKGKGPDMVQDRLSDEQKALMELVARLPEDFPVNTWEAMPTNKQRAIIGKTDLNDQEQWVMLNAGPSIKTLSMLLDLSQNQQEYGLTNAELLAVTDQLLELGNVRTGVQNHEIFPGHNGLQKAGHTFIANKEDAIMEDIKLSASDRRAENGQVEDAPDTRYNTRGSKAGELAQQRVNAVMAEFNDATGPYDRNTMTTEQLEILEEAEKTLWDKAYAGTLTEEEKNSILDRACGALKGGGSNNNSSIRYSPAENFRKLLAEKGYVIDKRTIDEELEKAGIDTSSLNEKQKAIAKEATEQLILKLKYNLLDDPEYYRTVREACRQIEAIDAGINAWGKKYWDTERQSI